MSRNKIEYPRIPLLLGIFGILILLAGCVRPAPNPAYPEPAMRAGAIEAVNPYPGPEVNDEVEYCRGAVEIPIAVWADGQYLYSQL